MVNEFLSLQSDFIEYTSKNGLIKTSPNEAICDLKEIYQMFDTDNKTETNYSCYKYGDIITAAKTKIEQTKIGKSTGQSSFIECNNKSIILSPLSSINILF